MRKLLFNNPDRKSERKFLRAKSTIFEKTLWQKLKNKGTGLKFIRQYSIGPYVVDFYCPSIRLVVEIDGKQHDSLDSIKYDKFRTNFLESLGIQVIRFKNKEIINNLGNVLEKIIQFSRLN